MNNDIRWQQRFDNFHRALDLLSSAMEERNLDDFSDLEQEGLIQRFEFSFELAWKTMKDYLEFSGLQIIPVTPKNVIKEALSARIIEDGQLWIDMMLQKNLLTHTYNKTAFKKALKEVKNHYLPLMIELDRWMKEKTIDS
jgi:nucleotidyltransferase substrate binding protein (TIGR01987 family)